MVEVFPLTDTGFDIRPDQGHDIFYTIINLSDSYQMLKTKLLAGIEVIRVIIH